MFGLFTDPLRQPDLPQVAPYGPVTSDDITQLVRAIELLTRATASNEQKLEAIAQRLDASDDSVSRLD